VTFPGPAGHELEAWFIPSSNGAVIVTVHDAGKNRATVLDEASLLAAHGYGLLMIDLEGFGDSSGRANAFGWLGARDVHAATAYLKRRGDVDPERIGGLGLSMGGEVLLQAAGESTDLKAIVSEGSTGRTRNDFDEVAGFDKYTMASFWTVAETAMRVMTGEPAPPPLKDLVQQIGPRKVLLLAGNLEEEQRLMGMYRDLGRPSFEMWSIPEARHVGAFDLHPREYETRVLAFFDAALLGESAGALNR
jgi:pimeloyl-ACP methyl ester carboxylesterase